MKLATRIFRREDWYVTSPFGWRKSPITKKNEMHTGTDYGTKGQKWNQYALEDGYILRCGKDNTGAIFAWVRYPRLGFDLLHYHLDTLNVKTKDKVTKDTVVGKTGRTGKATGFHLHLAMSNIGVTKRLDPHAYDYQEPVKEEKEEKEEKEPEFKAGDIVIPTRLVNYTGVRLRQYDKQYVISEVRGNRAVLKANRNGRLITWAAMNTKDIKKV